MPIPQEGLLEHEVDKDHVVCLRYRRVRINSRTGQIVRQIGMVDTKTGFQVSVGWGPDEQGVVLHYIVLRYSGRVGTDFKLVILLKTTQRCHGVPAAHELYLVHVLILRYHCQKVYLIGSCLLYTSPSPRDCS